MKDKEIRQYNCSVWNHINIMANICHNLTTNNFIWYFSVFIEGQNLCTWLNIKYRNILFIFYCKWLQLHIIITIHLQISGKFIPDCNTTIYKMSLCFNTSGMFALLLFLFFINNLKKSRSCFVPSRQTDRHNSKTNSHSYQILCKSI
jgi:hypothetical protein